MNTTIITPTSSKKQTEALADVIAFDPVESRRELAANLGADRVLDPTDENALPTLDLARMPSTWPSITPA